MSVFFEKIMPNVVEPNEQSWKADLVIFTVKNYQLENALRVCSLSYSDLYLA